ncbi:uncharacterized protein B0I36DRAFT_311871 [Microdochium trichocladiopsis]|uniref:Large ribosomal subunit protein mL50 n=1 Tax=Microdochium trichocladiopsis TaxID=1682393 RepID=A0A9P9C0C4_9PEZI|nr:uncharacterized protein B0I36DRAFT_311871 [Microdochium trichocladiopsis]KAH7040979.1 hypothetical protein B0I36DRAFT_311871 [Microdochium trichocladiopsis]
MRRIAPIRQAVGQLAGIIPTTQSTIAGTPASRQALSSPRARTSTRRTTDCLYTAQPASVRFVSTTSARHNEDSLPKSLAPDHDAAVGADVLAPLDNTHYRSPPVPSQAEQPEAVSDPTYVPATVADGLETIGGLGGWWDKSENYKQTFASFKPRRKISEPAALRLALRRAVVEAFALRKAGLESLMVSSWPVGGLEQQRHALSVTVGPEGDFTGDVQAVLADLQILETSACVPPSGKSLLSEADKVDDSFWDSIALPDDGIKFAVLKRFFQLTGQRVPDINFGSVVSARSVLTIVQQPPKAQTLAQEIEVRRPELFSVPNITFAAKRITRGDKDKSLGRFKVIEEELKKRDLPLDGHGFADKNREIQRHNGGV